MKARKEITVAVIIGLLIGLVIVGGVMRARMAIESISSPSPSASTSVNLKNKTPETSQKLFLDIETSDNLVVNKNTIEITGKTLPGTYVVILGEKGEYIIVPSEVGVFTEEVALVSGANTIKIDSYLEDGSKVEKVLTIVYTTTEL